MPESQESQSGHEAWYLAQLKPGGLDRAIVNLERQGYESFMPLREETYQRAGQWRKSAKPLFPGYLFVKVSGNQRDWRSINSTYGISRLVTLEGGRPTQVAPDIIRALQGQDLTGQTDHAAEALKVGDRVQVVSGPLSDKIAEIQAIPERDRIFVLLEFMGRYTRTEMSAADVVRRPAEPVSQSTRP